MNFDIQHWIEMAENDPEGFESERRKILEEFIQRSPNQRMLNGLQFRINMERERAKNPMDSCLRLSKMMGEHFYTVFCPVISHMKDLELKEPDLTTKQSAEIIPFAPKKSGDSK